MNRGVREFCVWVAKSCLGLGLRWVGVGGYVLVCRFGGNSDTASSQKGPFGKLSGFGRDNASVRLPKGRGILSKGCPSRETFGSFGRPAEVRFLLREGSFSRKREVLLETGVPLGNEGFSSKEGKLATGPSGSVESPKAERFWVWSSGNVASGLASDLVLRDLNQSGVREPREGDDFGQNFLGVFRVPDAIRNSPSAIRGRSTLLATRSPTYS